MEIPAVLAQGAGATVAGAEWIGRLPDLVESAARRWDLEMAAPFTRGSASWTAPARPRSGPWAGRDVVLKESFPHDEAACEADGLRWWNGKGSAVLLDSAGWSLLLDRCSPGTSLADDPRSAVARLTDASSALGTLHGAGLGAGGAVPDGIPHQATVCATWADLLEARLAAARAANLSIAGDSGLCRTAVVLLRTLPTSVAPVVVHGDANPGNLLRDRTGWAWIDPKPMIGDPAYDPWPLLDQIDDPHLLTDPRRELRERTFLAADMLGLDPARVAAWALARSVESAFWAWAEMADIAGARDSLERAARWAVLTD